jgi:hypothetical protein
LNSRPPFHGRCHSCTGKEVKKNRWTAFAKPGHNWTDVELLEMDRCDGGSPP